MKYYCWLAALLIGPVFSQTAPDNEEASLQHAVYEGGNSPVDFIRAMEDHLGRYPDAPRKAEIERGLLKSAIELKDSKRVIVYGERVLAREPDDTQLLQHVSVALLHQGDAPSAEKALRYAHHLQEVEEGAGKNTGVSGRLAARGKDEADRGIASALVMQARAEGVLGHTDKAIGLAEASYKTYPNVEAAHEAARWYSAAGKDEAAIQYLADAFTIAELRSTDPDAAQDRARMSELYRKMKGDEAGLGDLILQAYDRTSAQFSQRRAALRALDPNSQLKDPMQFTLSSLSGEKLKLSSLLGKVVVMDFWATWCAPCRVQHPLYEQVKATFKDRGDVVFLAIDTDLEHSIVQSFVQANQWSRAVYFEDGLSSTLQVTSIPTTMIFAPNGEIFSRMTGFVPENFVAMLTERINAALGARAAKPLDTSSQ